jgi:peptidoglycan hydrolase-like protein with peptidoglycan-binding domain
LRESHKKNGKYPPLSLFGHADPVGEDAYNKQLSGRRARAIYCLFTHDVNGWEQLYNAEWSSKNVLQLMRQATSGPQGQVRRDLMQSYMHLLFPSKLIKTDFLGQGSDAGGKSDYQGCSEVNPLKLLSTSEQSTLSTDQRNKENQPNRRVVVYLFCPGTKVSAGLWPCPRATESEAGCRDRFFGPPKTGDQRRAAGPARREFSQTSDTFACRFYDRIARFSPCESPAGPVVALLLKLVKVDDHFAPSTENLDIEFNITGYSARVVKLQIEAENYTGKLCFERELTADEKIDGTNKPITWDGKVSVGARKDRFATPLMGPFKVKLLGDDGTKDELAFKILYHSIELNFGKHTPDGALPPEAEKEKFAQAKLNELGYDAGPVNGTIGAVTQNALRRFQRANYKVGTQILLTVDGTLSDETFQAIKAAAAREIWETGATPLTGDAKFYIYDNFMNDPTMNFVTGGMPEFQSMNRKLHAEDKMDRPFLPLEIEVKLLNKANSGVSAPDAVGEVPVSWEVNDATEDASLIPATNPNAQTYVKNAREIGAAATVAGAARIDKNGDNALDTFQGFRKSTAAAYVQSMFPNDAGSKLEPYKIDRYDKESRGGTDFHQAIVKAWDDATKHPRCKGRAGVYFRFSTKGGDDAKIRVALTFKKLPNEKQLEADHKPFEANLFKETGRWTVWRRTRVSAYCSMIAAPPRASGSPNFATIAGHWKEAFIEVENGGTPLQTLTYTTVVTDAVYKAAVLGMPATHRPPGVTNAASLTYRPTAIYGGRAIAQNNGETAQNYINRVRNTVRAWCVNPINAILKVIHDEARKTSPEGFVIFDFRLNDAVTGQDWNPALNGGAGGFQPSANPAVQNFIPSTSGYVRCAGAVTMNVDNSFNVNCYLCHECGHARFLYHHKFVPETTPPNSNTSATPAQHDDRQARCTMSYAVPPDTPDQWRYPFCGKCILRLRGWNVTPLPNKYT